MGASISHDESREICLTKAVLASTIALIIGVLFITMRSGIDLTYTGTFKAIGIAWLLYNGPIVVRFLCLPRLSVYNGSILDPLLSLAALILLVCAGWSYRQFHLVDHWLHWVPACLGVCMACCCVLMWISFRRFYATCIFVLISVAIGLMVGCFVYTDSIHHPLQLENVSTEVFGHRDPFFHIAIANMLDVHATSSTGLDGLVPLNYHIGSHFVLLQLANLIGVSTIDAYQLVFPVVLIPWFSVGLLSLAQSIRELQLLRPRGQRSDFTYWILFSCGLIGYLPLPVGKELATCFGSSCVSESHILSMTLMFFMLSLCLHVYSLWRSGAASNSFTISILLLCIPVAAYITFTKISIPMVMLPVGIAACWRLHLIRSWVWSIPLTLAFLACILVFFSVLNTVATSAYRSFPLASVYHSIPREWWGYYFFVLHSWSFLYICHRFIHLNIHTIGDLLHSIKQRALIDVEILFLIQILCFGPALIYSDFANVFWFFEISHYIGLTLLLGVVGILSNESPHYSPTVGSRNISNIKIANMAYLFVLICIGITTAINAHLLIREYALTLIKSYPSNQRHQDHLAEDATVAFRKFNYLRAIDISKNSIALSSRDTNKTIDILLQLKNLTITEKRTSLVYIPKHNRDYWDLYPHRKPDERQCVCFISVAVSGMAQFDGVPEYDPQLQWIGLGFQDYRLDKPRPPQKPWRDDLENLKRRTKDKGFKVLFIIDQDESGKVYLEKVLCP